MSNIQAIFLHFQLNSQLYIISFLFIFILLLYIYILYKILKNFFFISFIFFIFVTETDNHIFLSKKDNEDHLYVKKILNELKELYEKFHTEEIHLLKLKKKNEQKINSDIIRITNIIYNE